MGLCRRLGLLAVASVAIDGSKFKAVNNRGRYFTEAKMKRRMAQIEESVARYLHQLESADRQERSKVRAMKIKRLTDRIAKLQEEMQRLEAVDKQRQAQPDNQISFTDPDARSMATSGRGSGVVGYNVQSAVDTEIHLIVAHEVTTSGSDRSQLAPMSKLTQQVLGVDKLDVVADRGYFSSEQIMECVKAGVSVTLPRPQTSNNKLKGLFVKADLQYVPDHDLYVCPANKLLMFISYKGDGNMNHRRYATKECLICKLRKQCATAKQRVMTRWEHEHVLEDVQRRLDDNPQAMRTRRETVEHPFWTIKARMGATHFLTRQLKNVKTEMALAVPPTIYPG